MGRDSPSIKQGPLRCRVVRIQDDGEHESVHGVELNGAAFRVEYPTHQLRRVSKRVPRKAPKRPWSPAGASVVNAACEANRSSMIVVVALLGGLIAAAGMWALASPARFLAAVSRWLSQASVRVRALARVIFAIALWFAADASRTPVVFEVLAVVTFVAGLALPFVGTSWLRTLIAWLAFQPDLVTREWALVMVLFGGFVIWAVLPALPIP